MSNRFDYLLYSFIEAQNDYKKFINSILVSISSSNVNYLNKIKIAFANVDIAEVIKILSAIFTSVPNELIKNTTEAYYHIYVHLILKLIGCEILSETSTNIGRIDAVVEFSDLIYIIEFKLSGANDALQQIIDKKYHESYLHKNKTIYLLGISFDTSEKNIRKEFEIEKVK